MRRMTPADLSEWDVTWTMAVVAERRTFGPLRVPAINMECALDAAHGLAYAINQGCGHVWKITDEVSVERASGDTR